MKIKLRAIKISELDKEFSAWRYYECFIFTPSLDEVSRLTVKGAIAHD
ncbi:MAG: hypothetical protein ACRCZS_13060 [Chroococcidiopsis sp.]